MDSGVRVIGFIDMDCFYVAVERALNPQLRGIPCAVVMYNTADRNAPDALAHMDRTRKSHQSMGGIIAVSYEARARGVTRQMSGKEALKICPELTIVQTPTGFGKADLRIYKKGGDDVVALLSRRADATEKRSVDEVAIDITSEARRLLAQRDWHADLLPTAQQVSHLADSALSRRAAAVSRADTRRGHEGQQKVEADAGQATDSGWQHLAQQTQDPGDACQIERLLVAGAIVVAELRAEVKAKLGFTCSGGIATNKILAKLGCGLHKPDQQTILLPHSVQLLMRDLPVDRLTGLGGQFGESIKTVLGVETVGDLLAKPRAEVLAAFPERGGWLLDFVAGKDSAVDSVKDRQLTKSLANSKTFFHNRALVSVEQVEHWLQEFACELCNRYQEQVDLHQRAPTTICVSLGLRAAGHDAGGRPTEDTHTKQQSINLGRHGTVAQIAAGAKECFRKWHATSQIKSFAITTLGLSLTGMEQLGRSAPITSYFKKAASAAPSAVRATPPSSTPSSAATVSNRPSSVLKTHMSRLFGLKPKTQSRSADAIEVVDESLISSPASTSAWRSDAVDESVLAELPWDLQQEVRSQMHQQQPAAKRQRAGDPPRTAVEEIIID